jgi:hypothetical protein
MDKGRIWVKKINAYEYDMDKKNLMDINMKMSSLVPYPTH